MVTCAMAHNGELFMLDMGKPVKILELAENMIRLSDSHPTRILTLWRSVCGPAKAL